MRFFPLSGEQIRDADFSVSPLLELMLSRFALRWPARHVQHTWWIEKVSPLDAHSSFVEHRLLLDALIRPYGWLPGFLMPSPSPSTRTWPTERAVIAAKTTDRVRSDLQGSTARGPLPELVRDLIAEPDAGLERILAALDAWWQVGIEPFWPQISTVLDADVKHRQHTLHVRSPRMLFSSIDRRLRWDGTTLHLPSESGQVPTHPTTGLTLMPSVFLDHRPMTIPDSPDRRLLYYPARNVSALWSAPAPPARALERLLGASRAQLLSMLTSPHTTAKLAALTQLAPASVSFHLGILREAGLARSQRVGRNVVYEATSLGEHLLNGTA